MQPIYLASKSPRRAELLTMMKVPFSPLVIDVPEHRKKDESAKDYSSRITHEKLIAARAEVMRLEKADYPVLCADTEVILGDEVLGKPENDEAAFNMLKRYSNNKHLVLTSVGIKNETKEKVILNETWVYFDEIPDEAIYQYIETGDHRDKSGSYGIQSYFGQFIKKIEGSFYAVMGLPLNDVRQLLNFIK